MTNRSQAQDNKIQRRLESGVQALIAAGQDFHRRGWSLATSSNYSILLASDPLQILMTASGKAKENLSWQDFVVVNESSQIERAASPSIDKSSLRPSAETALHLLLIKKWQAEAVLHTHSIFATMLSQKHAAEGQITIQGFEILKALNGCHTHECSITIPIFENNQNMAELAIEIEEKRAQISHAFLLKGHGLYTWGQSFEEAKKHLEALEFLFELIYRLE
ncbi:MAG: methylthioribulose 1-phosphate dehydratase [Candidatus Obscuribacterales bacterium]|nr:methylthioribulose 1-phosphate dehydratase [Candidatus Obscuribacterales bacterium]